MSSNKNIHQSSSSPSFAWVPSVPDHENNRTDREFDHSQMEEAPQENGRWRPGQMMPDLEYFERAFVDIQAAYQLESQDTAPPTNRSFQDLGFSQAATPAASSPLAAVPSDKPAAPSSQGFPFGDNEPCYMPMDSTDWSEPSVRYWTEFYTAKLRNGEAQVPGGSPVGSGTPQGQSANRPRLNGDQSSASTKTTREPERKTKVTKQGKTTQSRKRRAEASDDGTPNKRRAGKSSKPVSSAMRAPAPAPASRPVPAPVPTSRPAQVAMTNGNHAKERKTYSIYLCSPNLTPSSLKRKNVRCGHCPRICENHKKHRRCVYCKMDFCSEECGTYCWEQKHSRECPEYKKVKKTGKSRSRGAPSRSVGGLPAGGVIMGTVAGSSRPASKAGGRKPSGIMRSMTGAGMNAPQAPDRRAYTPTLDQHSRFSQSLSVPPGQQWTTQMNEPVAYGQTANLPRDYAQGRQIQFFRLSMTGPTQRMNSMRSPYPEQQYFQAPRTYHTPPAALAPSVATYPASANVDGTVSTDGVRPWYDDSNMPLSAFSAGNAANRAATASFNDFAGNHSQEFRQGAPANQNSVPRENSTSEAIRDGAPFESSHTDDFAAIDDGSWEQYFGENFDIAHYKNGPMSAAPTGEGIQNAEVLTSNEDPSAAALDFGLGFGTGIEVGAGFGTGADLGFGAEYDFGPDFRVGFDIGPDFDIEPDFLNFDNDEEFAAMLRSSGFDNTGLVPVVEAGADFVENPNLTPDLRGTGLIEEMDANVDESASLVNTRGKKRSRMEDLEDQEDSTSPKRPKVVETPSAVQHPAQSEPEYGEFLAGTNAASHEHAEATAPTEEDDQETANELAEFDAVMAKFPLPPVPRPPILNTYRPGDLSRNDWADLETPLAPTTPHEADNGNLMTDAEFQLLLASIEG